MSTVNGGSIFGSSPYTGGSVSGGSVSSAWDKARAKDNLLSTDWRKYYVLVVEAVTVAVVIMLMLTIFGNESLAGLNKFFVYALVGLVASMNLMDMATDTSGNVLPGKELMNWVGMLAAPSGAVLGIILGATT